MAARRNRFNTGCMKVTRISLLKLWASIAFLLAIGLFYTKLDATSREMTAPSATTTADASR